MVNLKKFFLFFIIVSILLSMQGYHTYGENSPANILVLNSYHQGFTWTDGQVDGILEIIQDSDIEAEIFIEYIDWKNHPNELLLDEIAELFLLKYKDLNIDLIITTDDAAMQFAIDYRQALFGDAPIIFGSVNKESALSRMSGEDQITGVFEGVDTSGTLDVINTIHEDVETVYAVTENTESGRSTFVRIDEANKVKNYNFELINLNAGTMDEIQSILSAEAGKAVAILANFSTDIEGNRYDAKELAITLGQLSQIPIYILHGTSMNEYVMGGSMLSPYIHGKQIGEMAIEFLSGTPIDMIPLNDDMVTEHTISYPAMERFGIDEGVIPESYNLLYKPFSFFEAYRNYILLAVIVFLIQIALIVGLLINTIQKRKAQKSLKIQHEELFELYDIVSISEEELIAKNESLGQQQQQLKEEEERYRLTAESAKDILWTWDTVSRTVELGSKIYSLLGWQPTELDTIDSYIEKIHHEDVEEIRQAFYDYIEGRTDKLTCEYRMKKRDNGFAILRTTGKGVQDTKGNYLKIYGTHTDITQMRMSEKKLSYMAFHDSLTQLYNRISTKNYVENIIEENKRFIMYFIDIDNFKFINNSYGHKVGDEILKAIAKRLEEQLGEEGFVGRIGGDEFVVIHRFELLESEEVKDLTKLFVEPFAIDDGTYYVSASVGYVYCPEDGESYDELLIKADVAMYKMKEHGKSQIAHYHINMHKDMKTRYQYRDLLRAALENNELSLNYQPQIRISDQQVVGYEALLRWHNEQLGQVSPAYFIPIAESSGLMVPIGNFVIEEAFRFAKDLNASKDDSIIISINLSLVQLLQPNFYENVIDLLELVEVNPHLIEFEVTESIYAEKFDVVKSELLKLRDKGFRIALDDFGTGYSSLTYLNQLPITTLKIDKAFIDEIDMKSNQKLLLESIIQLGNNMGLRVIAEGVETQSQLTYLQNHNCHIIQGYYYSKPLVKEAAIDFVLE